MKQVSTKPSLQQQTLTTLRELADGSPMTITLKRSLIGVRKTHRATVKALGLGKTGDVRHLYNTPSVAGMVEQVSYLLELSPEHSDVKPTQRPKHTRTTRPIGSSQQPTGQKEGTHENQ